MYIATAKTGQSAPSQSADEREHAAFLNIIRYFRENNAEGMRIRQRLAEAMAIPTGSDAKKCLDAYAAIRGVIRDELSEATTRRATLEQVCRNEPVNSSWFARELVEVGNAWDDLDRLWPAAPAGNETAATYAVLAQSSLKVLDNMIFQCACQSIPNELEEYLKNYRIGKCLDFIGTFQDQLPSKECTREVLVWLAPQDNIVSGLIDLTNARIIKADKRPWRQWLSVLYVVLSALAGFGLIALAVHAGPWMGMNTSSWPVGIGDWRSLNSAYVLVLLGVLVHWVLDRLKQSRTGNDVTPFSEWLLWLHVNEARIVVRVATVWAVMGLGVAFRTLSIASGMQPLTFFTAGYFVDSSFDALVGRFNTFISAADPAKKTAEPATAKTVSATATT